MKLLSVPSCILSPLVWLAAFLCALYPLNQFQLELMSASVLLLLLWSYDRLSRAFKNGVSMPRSVFAAAVAALWGLSFASIFWSEVPWISVMSFFFMGALPVTFLTLALSPYTQAEWKAALVGCGIVLGALGLWAIIQIMFFTDYVGSRVAHPLRDPNSLAALLNLVLLPALGWLGLAKDRRHAAAAFVLCLLLTGGLVATGSRGGFFMLLLGIALIVLFYRRAVTAHWRRWIMMGIVIAGCLAAPLFAMPDQRTMLDRVGDTFSAAAPDIAGERLLLMKTTGRMIGDRWLGGTGIGTYHLYYPAYRTDAQRDITTHAHNDPLQMWAEMGIGAPLLIYVLFVLAVCATRRKMRGLSGDARAPLILSFITLGVLMAHSHFNLNLYNLSVLMMAGLIMAYWFAQLDVPRRMPAPPAGKSVQAGLAVLFAVPILAYGCMMAGEHYLARARDAMMAGRIDAYGGAMLAADTLGFHRNPNVYLTAVHIPLALLHRNRHVLEADEWAKEAAQIDGNLDAALAGNPRLAAAWYFKGELARLVPQAARPDGLPDAEDAFRRALALDTLHMGARLSLIDMALEREDYDRAAELIRAVLGVPMNTAAAMDIYGRGLMVFTLLDDEASRRKTVAAMKKHEARMQAARLRQEKAPFRLLFGGTFPQAVESSEE